MTRERRIFYHGGEKIAPTSSCYSISLAIFKRNVYQEKAEPFLTLLLLFIFLDKNSLGGEMNIQKGELCVKGFYHNN
jgi:hypothetical protein